MKKAIVFAVLSIVFFVSNGCSTGSGEEIIVNRITFFVDGLKKDLLYVTVDQSGSDVLFIRGQIGSDVIEAFEFEVTRNLTGTAAINSMVFTQNNVQFYGMQGVYKNVTTNGEERVIRGSFSGSFRTLSGNSKIITDGTFTVRY